MRKYLAFFFLSITGFTMGGCHTSVEPLGPATAAKPGSFFIYHTFHLDSMGGMYREGYDTLTVIAKGTSYAGKTNVSRVMYGYASSGYINYESNGNISLYFDGLGQPGMRSGWLTVDIGSTSSDFFESFDSVYQSDSSHTQTFVDELVTGQENVTLAGHTFATATYSLNVITTDRYGRHSSTTTEWWAPEIGYKVKEVLGEFHRELVSYSLN